MTTPQVAHIEFLVEEPSAEAALRGLVPKITSGALSYDIRVFQGKLDLLSQLPNRLKGYRSWLSRDWRIVVMIDEDREDCTALKKKLEVAAQQANLLTRSVSGATSDYEVMNRLLIEELEAWFLGDVAAIVKAYPGVSPHLASQTRYRDPDAIKGGTWEALERVLQKAGYYSTGLPKVEAARAISEHMDPRHNRSKSFQVFRDSLLDLI